MKLALIDDDADDLAAEADYLTHYIEHNHIELSYNMKLANYLSPKKFVEEFYGGRFDLIVLDIFMDEMSGINVAQLIRTKDRDCIIIFVTSSDEFLLEGYQVFATGYFIKPLSRHEEEFRRTFDFIYPRLMERHQEIRVPIVRSMDVDVPYASIMFVDINEKHKLRIATRTRDFISSMPYEECWRWLSTDKRFLECHYRIIVNMDCIMEMQEDDFLLDDGRKVPISHRKRKEAKWQYMQYLAHKGE